MGAAERVFESLQDYIPFSFLGKFAAYEVGVTRQELENVDNKIITFKNNKGREEVEGEKNSVISNIDANCSPLEAPPISSTNSTSFTQQNNSSSSETTQRIQQRKSLSSASSSTSSLKSSSSRDEVSINKVVSHEFKLPCLATMAKEQMNKFRHGNFELWTKLYPVPPQFNALNSMEW